MKYWRAAAVLFLALGAVSPAAAKTDDIPPDYRGMSLELPAYEWQYLADKARVDFLVSFEALTSSGKRRVVATILQNVLVGRVMPPRAPGEAGTAQIYVNPNEGQFFALSVDGKNKYTVIERADKDWGMTPMEMTSLAQFIGRSAAKSPAADSAPGLVPKDERALAVPLPPKTLQGLKKGSLVDVYAQAPTGRVLAAARALVVDVRPQAAGIAEGSAWLATSGRVSEDLALAVFEGWPLEITPAQEAQ
jgi:hypothetical protein